MRPAIVEYNGISNEKFTKGKRYEAFFLEYWEGLLENLHDIQEYGEPQGRKKVMEKVSVCYKTYRDAALEACVCERGVSTLDLTLEERLIFSMPEMDTEEHEG